MPTDECEPWTHLQRRFHNKVHERLFQIPFGHLAGEPQEVKSIGVLGNLLRQFRVRGHQILGEVRRCGPRALHGSVHHHVQQYVAGPPVLDRSCRVPIAFLRALGLVEDGANMPQGNCATTCGTIASGRHSLAMVCMYCRFRLEKPFIWENSARRSSASRRMIPTPQPWRSCRIRICWPMPQYRVISSVLTLRWAVNRAWRIWFFNEANA